MAESLLSVRDLTVEFDTEDGIVHAVTGVSYDLSNTISLGAELGLRYQSKPGAEPLFADPNLRDVNDTGNRWSLPISVFARVRF